MSLTHTSAMPSTKFKGMQMQDVPPDYLLWISDQPYSPRKYPEIVQYVKENRDDLVSQSSNSSTPPMRSLLKDKNVENSLNPKV